MDDRHLAAAATAYGLLGEPAFSRGHESEADELGVSPPPTRATTRARPSVSGNAWERGGELPEFLSTYPSSETRVRELERLMPAALEIRRRRLQLEAAEAGGS